MAASLTGSSVGATRCVYGMCDVCVYMCVCACVRACVSLYMFERVRVFVCVCVRACMW